MIERVNLKKNFSVLIPDGESLLAPIVVSCLSQVQSIKINILSNKRFVPVRFSKRCSNFSYYKASNNRNQLSAILEIVKRTNSDIVLPVDQPTIQLLSHEKETLLDSNLTVLLPQPASFNRVSNKWLFAKFLQEKGFPHPSTTVYTNEEKIKHLKFPVLVKPVEGLNGEGIKIFNNPGKLYSFFDGNLNSKKYIIQSFITGYDIDCSVLCQEGKILVYTIQKGIYPGIRRFSPPSAIEFLFDDQVFKIVTKLMQKLKWSGVAHIDLRYDEQDNTVKILEVNPRYWGSLLGSQSAGVNFPYLACLTGLGRKIPRLEYQFKRYSAIQEYMRILVKNLLKGRKTDLNFNDTNLRIFVKDPIIEIVRPFRFVFEQLFRGIKKLFNRSSNQAFE